MKILITGGAGFIGSHTAELFLKAGHNVRILDDFSSGKRENLAAIKNEIDLIEGNILNIRELESACQDMDAILHLAAVSSVEKSFNQPLLTHAVNATGSLNVIEAAHGARVKRVILASSAAVYGDHPELPKQEDSPVEPQSPYAWHKLTGEFYGKAFKQVYDVDFGALRYFNVYGPRQDPDSPYSGVLSIFVQRALVNQPLVIHGDGEQTRDFIHVSDVAQVNLLATESEQPLVPVLNVATGYETRIIDAADMIRKAAGSDALLEHGAIRPGDIRRSFATPRLLREIYGYAPKVKIEPGLKDLVRSLQDSSDQLN